MSHRAGFLLQLPASSGASQGWGVGWEGGSLETFFTCLGWPAPDLCLHGPGLELSPLQPHSWSGSSEPPPPSKQSPGWLWLPRARLQASGAGVSSPHQNPETVGVGLTTCLLLPWSTAPNLSPSAMMQIPRKTSYKYHFPSSSSAHRDGQDDPSPLPSVLSRATDSRGERNLSGQQFAVQTARGG